MNSTGGEQGLLGLAFAPDYARSGRFYVDYTSPTTTSAWPSTARSGRNPELADPGARRTVLTIDHHTYTNHNGGQLRSAPTATCTSASATAAARATRTSNGQNTDALLGKILRIDPATPTAATRSRPATRSSASAGKRPEIWAYGLRNPWRFSFDRTTGDLLIGDVGQDT